MISAREYRDTLASIEPTYIRQERVTLTAVMRAAERLVEHMEELKAVGGLFLTISELAGLLKVSTEHARLMVNGPLLGCTVPIGKVDRRVFLPLLLEWCAQSAGRDIEGNLLAE